MGSSEMPWKANPEMEIASAGRSSAEEMQAAGIIQSAEELAEERRKIRRLQIVVSMAMQVIAQDAKLSVEEAAEMVADTRRAALAMFPDKELAFNLIYWPRLQRLMRERYRMQ